MSPPVLKPAAGKRPPVPVRQDDPPDDYLCTWSYVQAAWSDPVKRAGYWELKYIHAACREHARLAAA